MIEFIFEKIIMPFLALVFLGLVCLCVLGIFCIPSCIEQEKIKKQQIKECFMQEPRTKECEYILWQYELEKQQKRRNNTTVMPMPMVIRH